MKQFYLDLAKICFGIGFYGCVTRLDDPLVIFIEGVLSVILALIFVYVASRQKEIV